MMPIDNQELIHATSQQQECRHPGTSTGSKQAPASRTPPATTTSQPATEEQELKKVLVDVGHRSWWGYPSQASSLFQATSHSLLRSNRVPVDKWIRCLSTRACAGISPFQYKIQNQTEEEPIMIDGVYGLDDTIATSYQFME